MKSYSSIFTFPLKFFSPLLGIFILLIYLVNAVEYFEYWTLFDYLYLIAVTVGNFYIYKFFTPLKNVKRVENKLVVSNYREKIEVPVSEITELHRSFKFIHIHFENNTVFGDEILLLPVKVPAIGSNPDANLHYIASNLDLWITADGNVAVRRENEYSEAEKEVIAAE